MNLHHITTALAATGAKIPAAVTTATAEHARITAGITAMQGGAGTAPAAIIAAILDGRDPATDPAVQQAIAADTIAQERIVVPARTLADERFCAALAASADKIVAALQTRADHAAAEILAAQEILGSVDPADPVEVVQLGGEAAEAWSRHQTAVQILDRIGTARATLGQALRWSEPSRHVRALRWAPLTLAQAEHHGATPEQLVRAGVPLVLADAREVSHRLAALEQERQALAAQREREALNAYRSQPVMVRVPAV